MRITRLYLRNYRVYQEELDLQIPAGLVGIYGPNGGGKCLPASTRVWDGDTGEAVEIERFVSERRKRVLAFTEGRVTTADVTDWHRLGKRPTVDIVLSSGASLRAATSHPIVTDRGCVRAGDLRAGDWVAEVRNLPALAPPALSSDEALLLGLLLGDGCLTQHQVRFSATNADVIALFKHVVSRIFPYCVVRTSARGSEHAVVAAEPIDQRRERRCALSRRLLNEGISLEDLVGPANVARFVRGESSPGWDQLTRCEDDFGIDLWDEKCALFGGRAVKEWASSLGIDGSDAFTKRVPPHLLLLPDVQVRHLLAGLWLTDGYVGDPEKSGTLEASYTSRSRQLAADVRILLLRLGIGSTIRSRQIHGQPAYTVCVTAAGLHGLRQLPLVGAKAERLDRAVAARTTVTPHPTHDLIPPSFLADLPTKARSGRERTRAQLTSSAMSRELFADFGGDLDPHEDISWSRVVEARTTSEAEECFDLTVDTPEHLFVAETFIVHNSALVESIRWTLFGKSRTSNDQIRTSDIKDDCITEVEFEHEGHLYLVRRTIAGANHTVKAEAHWNGQLIAEGVRDVASYVQSVIGMDDTSFRASVFAEQKQVAAFSSHTPQKRRDLVLRLLGITPLDKARDSARADARDALKDHERLVARLPNLGELEEVLATAEAAAAGVKDELETAEAAVVVAGTAVEAAEAAVEELEDVARTYDALVVEGRAAAERVEESKARIEELTAEQATLADADTTLAELRPVTRGIDALEALAAAQAVVEALPALDEPPAPQPDEAEALRAAAEEAAAHAAGLAGALRSAEDELARAEQAAARSAELSPDEDCPVCGQSLGDAFEQVVAHRDAEVKAATARVAGLKKELAAAQKAAKSASTAAEKATKALTEAQQAWTRWEHHLQRRAEADAALTQATTHPFFVAFQPPEGANATKNELAMRKRAATEVARLEARLERAPKVAEELAAITHRFEEATSTREALREKVKSLGFKPADLEARKTARQQARVALKQANEQTEAVRRRAAAAVAAVDTATARLADGKQAHADLADLAERSRHLARVADLLHEFRNNVIATVGPTLAGQAAELFDDLTDHEYDRLEVDPETYEIQIRDGGQLYGMDRFSGSEVDLANLALRVAISEHVRFQSGGTVGLLVLDEVFGPLDDERKERMLLALERLKGRFRQVLVVTHDSAIKEQLPSAIQVEKLPGRRARATVLSGV